MISIINSLNTLTNSSVNNIVNLVVNASGTTGTTGASIGSGLVEGENSRIFSTVAHVGATRGGLLSNTDPWHYLGVDGAAIDQLLNASTATQVVSSLYILFKTIGIIGCAITMVFALTKLAASNGNGRAEAKQMFTKKVVILLAIFLSAYVFGTIWGIIANM